MDGAIDGQGRRVTGAGGLVEIDGAAGEGGGQVLRSALALSLATGRPFRITDIRGRRKKPGLLRQHLTCVQVATRIGCAQTEGAELGGRTLVFRPQALNPIHDRFAIGTAGSTSLVIQSVLPALLIAGGPSQLDLEGGTHNPMAPPFDMLARSFVPMLRRLGADVDLELQRHGFAPAGGGKACLRVRPQPFRAGRLELDGRGDVRQLRVRAVVAELPLSIAEREVDVVRRKLGLRLDAVEVAEVDNGPGNTVSVEAVTEHGVEVFTAFGEPGRSAERVAAKLVREVKAWLRCEGAAIGEYHADQLLLPLALTIHCGGEGGRFTTVRPSSHTETNARVIEGFLPDVKVDLDPIDPTGSGAWRVDVRRA